MPAAGTGTSAAAGAVAVSAAQKRMSLDSYQHAAISRRIVNEHFEASGHRHAAESYLNSISEFERPMWSNEQLNRTRRSSSSHTRGVSCPTLNITRIMRSISVSSGSSSNSSSISAGSRDGRAFVRQSRRDYAEAPSRSRNPHDDTATAQPQIPPRIIVDGLRRRTTTSRRETGTPDIIISRSPESLSPLSPPLTEEAYSESAGSIFDDHTMSHGALYHHPHNHRHSDMSATHSASSATSSARWSTISAGSPHKRYSDTSVAIAVAFQRAQLANRSDAFDFGDLSYLHSESATDGIRPRNHSSTSSINSHSDNGSGSVSCGGDEAMTITLKGPPRGADDIEHNIESDSRSQVHQQHHNTGDDTGSSNGLIADRPMSHFPKLAENAEPSSQRPSGDGMRSSSEVPIPAVYLDSTASLWDQYMAELDSNEFDSKIHLKRQRISQFLRVPWSVEKLLWFGVAICFDALIHVFSILPAKFIRATVTLALSVFYDLPELIDSAFASAPAQTVLHALPGPWNGRVLAAGRGIRHWTCRLCGRSNSDQAVNSDGTSSQNISRWLSPSQLFDFYRGLLLIFTCVALCRIDTAQMYHTIRAQSSLKLYFIFSALDIFDRLLSSFGHDVLDALQSTVTDPRSQRWKTGAGYFVLAQIYMLIHTLVLFYQVITLNVAVNAYSDQLLSLLISNQFVEIKSNVFKKWEKEMLFQIACADIVERFQEIVFLFIIILRNMAELSGNGMSPLFGSPTPSTAASGAMGTVVPAAQPPVSFDSATPLAFGPLIPSWVSIPLINRILTPVLMVLGTEILIDWIKHAFVTKLNWIRPEIYSHYIDILSRDLACSKSGVRARGIVPPTPTNHVATSASVSASDADEKIERPTTGDICESRTSIDLSAINGSSRVRSSSILVHAALKAIAWVHSALLSDSDDDAPRSTSAERRVSDATASRPSMQLHPSSYGRSRGHRRVQSVTQPQIFVEQSSRVARRIGLSPMPLACLITLMLMQVSYILMQSSSPVSPLRPQDNGVPARSAPVPSDPISTLWLVGWLSAVPVLGFVLRTAAHAIRLVYGLLSVDAISYLGYLILHPHKAISLLVSMLGMPLTLLASVFSTKIQSDPSRLMRSSGWSALDVLGWVSIVLIAYALVVWTKLAFGNRLMQFAWNRYRDFERRSAENRGTELDTGNLKQYDDSTKKVDNTTFFEVGKLIAKEGSEAEWEKQRPKWTLDNIERYSLFKSRIP
ncbi:hypothetical protein LPJ53_002831 [Coemansia erecta]|uniref:DUF747-domain-containing protein n=1 Tax=Coemansia erecta TaxID=147472 RepID=A0A9W7Y3E7_9FUNG|nr:hypothetical protein LPJ53_002831 [Coemansia erecta]